MTRAVNVLYLVKHFPCRSQTFVLNEVVALRARGAGVHVVSAINLHETIALDPEIANGITYLEHEYAYRYGAMPSEPSAADPSLATARAALASTGDVPLRVRQSLWDILGAAEEDQRLRARGFLDALAVASLVYERAIDHLHCDFAEDNVKLAHIVSLATGVPFTFKMRAYDIFAEPHPLLLEWMHAALQVFTISQYNRDYICRRWGIHPARVAVVYDGVDPAQTAPVARYVHEPFRIVSVSRLVEKKGFDVLLNACARLKGRVAFRCDIYGDGPLMADLAQQSTALGLDDCVTFHGSRPHDEVLGALEKASVFVLACVQARNGDRDGTPNALLEAMARGIPVVSTRLSGIPEIVEPDVDGLLVPPGDAGALADAITRLASDRGLAERLRDSAQRTVRARFTIDRTVDGFLSVIADRVAAGQGSARQPGPRG